MSFVEYDENVIKSVLDLNGKEFKSNEEYWKNVSSIYDELLKTIKLPFKIPFKIPFKLSLPAIPLGKIPEVPHTAKIIEKREKPQTSKEVELEFDEEWEFEG